MSTQTVSRRRARVADCTAAVAGRSRSTSSLRCREPVGEGQGIQPFRGGDQGAIAVEQAGEQQELIGRQRVAQPLHAQRSAGRA